MNTDNYHSLTVAIRLPLAAFGLFLGACSLPQAQTDTVRHFTLAGPTEAVPVVDCARVQPVVVAGHLRSRSMAVRIAENEVIYLDDVVWAESLSDGITQVLRNRLGAVASDAVVSVQIQRCELNRAAGNAVQLVASYTIVTGSKIGSPEDRGLFTAAPRSWDGKDYGTLVGLVREAVGELADRLVARLPEKK